MTAAGAVAVGAAAGVSAEHLARQTSRGASTDGAIPFVGQHQAGIATPSQDHLQFAAFDLATESTDDLRQLLVEWTRAAGALTQGQTVGALETGDQPPEDTGEAEGLGPAQLTITFGVGPTIFERDGKDRFGLRARRPSQLVELPAFAGDAIDPARSAGDLCVQVCGNDPQVTFHALHNLIRLASPAAVPRWSQIGFGNTANSRSQTTPRNLMGFKDGTNNIQAEDAAALDSHVWSRPPDPARWMHGGTYMVVRRIRMLLGVWDATSLNEQEAAFGRHKVSGAPLGGRHEHDAVDLEAQSNGLPVVPANAHIRLASPASNADQRILRRGYSFDDGIEHTTGAPDAGLLFICFQRDPRKQFIPIQRRLAGNDGLSRHIEHVGSAIFACPPGARPGGFVGQGLFA